MSSNIPPHHILFLTSDRTKGGIQRALSDWAGVIAEIPNCRLTVMAPADEILQGMQNLSATSINIQTYNALQRQILRWIPALARVSVSGFRKKADICFVHNSPLIPASRIMARRTIGVCHNDKPMKFLGADHLICFTQSGIDKALGAGWAQDQLTCMPHFIHSISPSMLAKKPNGEALHIIAAGRLVAKKNFSLFIEIAAQAKSVCPNLRFTLAGTGPEADRLARQNRAAGTPAHLIGWSDLNALAATADIFCTPSLDEPYGYVLTEMMQAGLAILASPSFGAEMILDSGNTAPLLPFDEAKPWADKILNLQADRAALSSLQQACTARLQDPIFSRARFRGQIEQLIKAQL